MGVVACLFCTIAMFSPDFEFLELVPEFEVYFYRARNNVQGADRGYLGYHFLWKYCRLRGVEAFPVMDASFFLVRKNSRHEPPRSHLDDVVRVKAYVFVVYSAEVVVVDSPRYPY